MILLAAAPTTTTTPAPAPFEFPALVFSALLLSSTLLGIIVAFLPDRTADHQNRIRSLGFAGTAAAAFFGLWAAWTQATNASIGNGGTPGGELMESRPWFSSFGFATSYHLDADGVALMMVYLSCAIFLVAGLSMWRVRHNIKLTVCALLFLETAINGIFLAADWVLFLGFWVFAALPVYLFFRGHEAVEHETGRRWLWILLSSGALIAAGAALIIFQAGTRTFDMAVQAPVLSPAVVPVAFWIFVLAFVLIAAAFPLHPPFLGANESGSAIIAAVVGALVPTVGAYGLMRIVLVYFPQMVVQYSLFFAALGTVAALWGAVAAFTAPTLRRMVGYIGMAQIGAVLLAISAHNSVSISGATLLLISRGLCISVLYLVCGVVESRCGTSQIRELGGLAWKLPRLAWFWAIATLGLVGVPLLSGFAANLYLFIGTFDVHRGATVLVLAGMLISAAALLWHGEQIFFGAMRERFSRVRDVGTLESSYLAILVILIFFFGILPNRFLELIQYGAGSITGGTAGG